MSRHTKSYVTTSRAVCYIFQVPSGVCRDILRLCRDTEGSIEILLFYSLCCDIHTPCCKIVTSIELAHLLMVSCMLIKYISSPSGLIWPLSKEVSLFPLYVVGQ
ncbi:hypothetical protein PVK06_021100 [Gossypium arboreum]|uniref:Uncharacterized protein n=1 Tax=Gossypium arboreum TaxID=29729 RepID=A0ABR0PPS8_GOSAR|nr:hypothetical protein PVK06_021100 [Gossypium arboreum]